MTLVYSRLSSSSPFLPGTVLGNITQIEGTGNSSYNALWLTLVQRFSNGLQLNASYMWSKSIDYNSLSSTGTSVQNSYNLKADRGLSDFDARNRFVSSAIYELPFKGNRIKQGWQLACIFQAQSGNPVNIVVADSTVNASSFAGTAKCLGRSPATEKLIVFVFGAACIVNSILNSGRLGETITTLMRGN